MQNLVRVDESQTYTHTDVSCRTRAPPWPPVISPREEKMEKRSTQKLRLVATRL